ncbi:MAG: hypothetical protein ACYTGQ_16825 [Planctomycetota bacterium]|jgi:hypothetical protein
MNLLKPILATLALILTLGAALPSGACQIPVFRYALERWDPDLFTAVIFHHGPLTDEQQALVQQLRDAADSNTHPLNLDVHLADTSIPLNPSHALLNQQFGPHQASSDTPWMMVRFPHHVYTDSLAFAGPLDEHNVKTLIDSPARREIVERIISGQSAVWVLIESGDQAADDQAEQTLREELARMQNTLKLPSIDDLKNDEYYIEETTVDLRLEFSIIRLDPKDPEEHITCEMLRNSEEGLNKVSGPIAIPIFGRGRSYYALAGSGISPGQIESNCSFITGACSCQVKQQNPGADILFAVNWNARVTDSAIPDKPLPELSGLGLLDQPNADAKPVGLSTFAPSSAEATTLSASSSNTISLNPANPSTTPQTLATVNPENPTASTQSPVSVSLIALIAIALIAVGVGSIFIKSNRND